MGSFVKCVMFVTLILKAGYGARILGIFPCPSYSHQIVFHPLYRELSLRGHEVVVFTPNPLKDPSLTNLTEIDMGYLYKYQQDIINAFLNSVTFIDVMVAATKIGNKYIKELFENEEFKKLYHNATKEKFDLVLVEGLYSVATFGHLFNTPCIGVYSLEALLDSYTTLGGIIHPAIYGGLLVDFDYPVSMWHKIQNVFNFILNKIFVEFFARPAIDQLNRLYLGDDFPPVTELEKNISMLFVTKNIVMSPVRPMPASIVQLDFMHIHESKPLPNDLQEILDNATQGAIYFSLGSNVKSSTLPSSLRNSIIETLSSLPYIVLWKWESDERPGVNENVITRKWFPQQDILGHPNIKAFVTQGGLQSCEEAIAKAVPMVGLPAIADQEDNINKLVRLGVATRLALDDLTTVSLKQAIIEIAENEKYAKKIKELRDIAFDQPMRGLEKAVWWSEYVIRNKGAPVLRSALADMPLYEYLLLDVIFVLLIGLLILYFFIKNMLRFLCSIRFKTTEKRKLK